jgi:hypothetical protein
MEGFNLDYIFQFVAAKLYKTFVKFTTGLIDNYKIDLVIDPLSERRKIKKKLFFLF